jgi:hypothetical protein
MIRGSEEIDVLVVIGNQLRHCHQDWELTQETLLGSTP